jgi:hypothetical protein
VRQESTQDEGTCDQVTYTLVEGVKKRETDNKNDPPLCGPPGLSTRRDQVRQPFSHLRWLPRAVVIGLALTAMPTGIEQHRRVP